jgi:hypothetical protein
MPMNVLVGKANKSEMVYLRSTFNEKKRRITQQDNRWMDYHPHIIHNGTYLKNVKGKPFSMLIKKKKSLIERKAYFYDYKKAVFLIDDNVNSAT